MPSGKASSSEPARPEPRERRARLRNPPFPGPLWDEAVWEERGSFESAERRPFSGAAEEGAGDEPRVCFAR